MRWAIDVTGTKSGVAKKVTEQLDKIAATYEEAGKVTEHLDKIAAGYALAGKEERNDVVFAKERILALVAAVDLTPDESTTEWNAIKVKASGVHSINDKGIREAHMAISVVRTHVESLD